METFIQHEKLSGVVERVTFHSVETGWSVLKVSPFNEPNKITTVLIHQAKVFAGASMEFHGSWTHHQKFGEQFKANKAIEKKPASSAALEKYLGSGLIKGVGPKTAKKIVKYLGERTLEVFENSIEELLNVPSIAEKKLKQIKDSWEEHRSIRDVMMFLQSYGVSTLFAVKVFKAYGDKAIETVSSNPYKLARDIYGIGFFSADRIALAMEFKEDGKERIQAGIKHVLASSREEGHCYLLKEQIIKQTLDLLKLNDEGRIEQFIISLFDTGEILKRQFEIDGKLTDCYYSKSLYWDEDYVVKKVNDLNSNIIDVDLKRVENWVKSYCDKFNISLSDEQKHSVIQISSKSFSILTGGPGCGKTTTTKVLVKLLQAMKKKILLAAPTGRAAQRMTEVIGKESKTIHRLLEWEPQNGGFKKGEEDNLNCDFLIVDECSMLDVNIAASLLKAVSLNCQVLFIGDPDQLPSVGAGAVLQDLLACENVQSFRLTKIFRQAAESSIIKYAHEINKGFIPKIESPIANQFAWDQKVDCLFVDAEEATQEQLKFISRLKRLIREAIDENKEQYIRSKDKKVNKIFCDNGKLAIQDIYSENLNDEELKDLTTFIIPEKFKKINIEKFAQSKTGIEELKSVLNKVHPWSTLNYGLTAIDSILRLYTKTIPQKLGKNCEIQILTPQVRGSLGTVNLNEKIQEATNPIKPGSFQIKMGERFFREGDRVIQTRNNYDLNVFNGDIGIIKSIDSESYSVSVYYKEQDRMVIYKKEDLTELKLAYAITIHKSQGSEFSAVIIPVSTQHFKMLFRNLIYTGLTRGKKLVVFVGSRKALALAIRSIDNRKRQTGIVDLMTKCTQLE